MIGTKRVLALAAVLVLAGCAKAEPELPYGTAQLMMANEVQPTAQSYWDSVRYISELVDGVAVDTAYEPKTEADWLAVEQTAAHLGELGETLKSPGYSEGRGEDWLVFAQGLVDVSKAAGDAAKTRDPDKVFEAGALVYNVCAACHQAYPPSEVSITPDLEPNLGPAQEPETDAAS